jgi:multidrug efflux system outer membrane protein
MPLLRRLALALLPLALAACAVTAPPSTVPAPAPAAWHAPLPHGGSVDGLARWWRRMDDPLLAELIAAAQEVSPGVAQARSRFAQARATHVAARAALLPTLDAQGTASRGRGTQLGLDEIATLAQGTLQAGWEADLFGANAAQREAATQRLAGARAQWHEARVSVAAEVALAYADWRHCTQLLAVAEADARSRGETARLSRLSEQAGFTAPANAALAQASASESRARATQQRMACEVGLKGLVALTGWDEPRLRERLAAQPGREPPAGLFAIAELPLQVIAQRPDVYSAARDVAAASADVASARAQRLPSLSLGGQIGVGWISMGGFRQTFDAWSAGPLALNLPLFDGGRRAAQVDAASARYGEAVAVYQGRVRQAVSEVEQALVRLQAADARNADAESAAAGYRTAFAAAEARWRGGLASIVELEDVRRGALASDTAVVNLRQERMAAWIALYRAAGGGWNENNTEVLQ